jgi:hypothetical protein
MSEKDASSQAKAEDWNQVFYQLSKVDLKIQLSFVLTLIIKYIDSILD